MPLVFLSLGSNKGNRLHTMARACKEISIKAGEIAALSSMYETEPWGFQADQNFFNLVVSIETQLEPNTLIRALLNIETLLGRQRQPGGFQSREIDIDILFYDNRVMMNNELQIPHPRLHQRMFVLKPLDELAPDFVHPVFGKAVSQLMLECNDEAMVFLRYDKVLLPGLFEESLMTNP
jgi:2-amino-4-hydroxy-6-hydroxymethyldihydropteridine diphosphokinase